MSPSTELFALEVVLWVVVPAVAGPLIARWASGQAKRAGATPVRVRGLEVLVTIVWVAIVIAGLSVLLAPLNFVSTLTVSAIGGIAVTLALQTTLQNLVCGLILLQNRVLRVGDSVQFSGLNGVVVAIGLVKTVIKLPDGTLAFVSNSNLLNGPLINSTAGQRFLGEY